MPPSSLTFLQTRVDSPLCSPTIAGTPSVIIPMILFRCSFMSSTVEQIEANKSIPLGWSLRLWKSSRFLLTRSFHCPLLSKKSVTERCQMQLCFCRRLTKKRQTQMKCLKSSMPQCHKPGKNWQTLAFSKNKFFPPFSLHSL